MLLQLRSSVSQSLKCLDTLPSKWLQFPLGNGGAIHYCLYSLPCPGVLPHEDLDSPLVDRFQV